jgi:hypothetical protein
MPPGYESFSSPNGLEYAVAFPFSADAPSTPERELLHQTIELCTFDWRRLVWGEDVQQAHVVTFHWVDTPGGLEGLGGIRRGNGSYSAPATAFAGGQGDLGVYAVRILSGVGRMQPWASQEHHVYLLRNIDMAPGTGNPLPVGGPKVFRDTLIRCLGMMVTWCGAVANPYARDRLARVFGWTGEGDSLYSYLDAEGNGSGTWWGESGLAADLGGTRDDVDTATLPWASRISEHVAEAFKDRFLPADQRAFTARTGATPSNSCGWPRFTSGPETINDVFLDEMGSYNWGPQERDTVTTHSEGGFPDGGVLHIANVDAYATHNLPTGLPEDFPVPILDVAPNSPDELAQAARFDDEVPDSGGYTIDFPAAPFGGCYWLDPNVKHPGPEKWVEFGRIPPVQPSRDGPYYAHLRSFDKSDAAFLQLHVQTIRSSGIVPPDATPPNPDGDPDIPPTWLELVAQSEWTEPPFYVHIAPPPIIERRSYLRSRVICNSRPVAADLTYSKVTAYPADPGWRRRHERIF